MTEGAPLVLDLLNYIEQVEKLKAKPAFSVPSDYFSAYQHELTGLPELQLNLQEEGDDVWLRLPRLQEIGAPEVDALLAPWVTLPRNPEKMPELKPEITIAEILQEPVRKKLSEHPEVGARFAWYLENQWRPWATVEASRRRTIAQYNKLFSLQQVIAANGTEAPLELVWGIGNASWKMPGFATAVTHPLIVQQCEMTLNEKTFELEIRPRDVEPRLEVDCYTEMELAGVRQLDGFWKSALAAGANRPNPFEADSFEGVLKAAVGHLDPTGNYQPVSRSAAPPPPGEKLIITDGWVLFARKRSGDVFLEDIRRLKTSVEAASSLPEVIRSFVELGSDTVRARPEQAFRGLSSSDTPPGALELYFPMPYNEEQVSIIKKLELNDGVVVQGPPGTGKTHTIANVICHYLAQGKKVLVTAKGESALAVLREKIPERIRPLSVALLSDERDGMKRFEHSIQTIASSVAALDPSRALARIGAAETRLNQLHAQIAHVDQAVASYAARHMRDYTFQGKTVTPGDMARLVMEQEEEHRWFDDSPAASDGALPFGDADIASLRAARRTVAADLVYLPHSVPLPQAFPEWPAILAMHQDLVRARSIAADVAQGTLLDLADSTPATLDKAAALAHFLDERAALVADADAALPELPARMGRTDAADPMLLALLETCGGVRSLEAQRRQLMTSAIVVPAHAELNEDYMEALPRLAAGKSAFVLPFGKGAARDLIKATTVLGAAPADQAAWKLVTKLLEWRTLARTALARWNALAAEFNLETVNTELDTGFRRMAQLQGAVQTAHRLTFEYNAHVDEHVAGVFGRLGVERLRTQGESALATCSASLRAHLEKAKLARALNQLDAMLNLLSGQGGPIVEQVQTFLTTSLGQAEADTTALQNHWRSLQAELTRLQQLRPALDEIARLAAVLAAAGAPLWAERVRTIVSAGEFDAVLPARWLEAWTWRQAVQFLEGIDGHAVLREHFQRRRELTDDLAATYQDLIAEKTWLGVFNNSPDSVRQALQAYLTAVQKMGAGTGIRAIRYRKDAREAMVRAYQAVPCWVLPQWRVSETLPAEIGLFDLVVIDEASQSDIWALPALLRGKKLLVVGDHHQVSPSAVGTAEERIKELIGRFLGKQPHGAQMTPEKSIYDLARVVFAGNSVMLKEHFRSVPAIIEFSNREFYEGDIRPLRLPSAAERLDPPLIDVFVEGGFRKGDTNPPEAAAVVGEIEAILADPALAERSIGVVTLLGTAQAAHIHSLLTTRIAPADIIARRIEVGPPPVFQGRERDIMLISMVLGPADRAAANRDDMRQRFNVAMSRARDRMILFRSVGDTHFKDDTLNGKVIRHFRQPFHQDTERSQQLRERCESGFETEMFDELVQRGYRVEPQVPCGGYRIDLVVEGAQGRRLAIECDGDRYHGLGQWSDDMARQRVLERAGWTFWRCFASSFVRRRAEVLADLLHTLTQLGIEPLGADAVDQSVWVHSKTVDPFKVSALPPDEKEAA